MKAVRALLALALAAATLGVDVFENAGRLAPISDEFARHNPFARLVLALLGFALVWLVIDLRRDRPSLFSWWAAALLPSLIIIAATDPREKLHLAAFAWLLIGGVIWMVAYAFDAGMRALAVSVGLVVVGAALVGFCLYITSAVVEVRSISPLGFFQRVFLILFAVVLGCGAGQGGRISHSC